MSIQGDYRGILRDYRRILDYSSMQGDYRGILGDYRCILGGLV